jgi:hypothetical protein
MASASLFLRLGLRWLAAAECAEEEGEEGSGVVDPLSAFFICFHISLFFLSLILSLILSLSSLSVFFLLQKKVVKKEKKRGQLILPIALIALSLPFLSLSISLFDVV